MSQKRQAIVDVDRCNIRCHHAETGSREAKFRRLPRHLILSSTVTVERIAAQSNRSSQGDYLNIEDALYR